MQSRVAVWPPLLLSPAVCAWLILHLNFAEAAVRNGQCKVAVAECDVLWMDIFLVLIWLLSVGWHVALILTSKNKMSQIFYALLNMGLAIVTFLFIGFLISGD